jgi:aspartyl-tRNA(Asn)/glutamyl-tRNA(Gln) amidotransferase subunit C
LLCFREAVKVLEDSIEFASKIHNIETDDSVQPLYTVLEDYQLQLREDKVTDGNIKEDVMKNAMKVEEEYFIAPK